MIMELMLKCKPFENLMFVTSELDVNLKFNLKERNIFDFAMPYE